MLIKKKKNEPILSALACAPTFIVSQPLQHQTLGLTLPTLRCRHVRELEIIFIGKKGFWN